MHELSIATSIVETVGVIAAEQQATVGAVAVRVGALSGVVPDALRFAWDVATRGTAMDGATLNIDEVAAAVWCPSCQAEQAIPGGRLRCPVCGTATPRVVRGRELEILSLEINDDIASATHP